MPNKKTLIKRFGLFVAMFVLLLLSVVACGSQELSFETIEQLNNPQAGQEWRGKEPNLIILATAKEIVELERLATEDAQTQLRAVDFETYFVIATFLGLQRNIHQGITIEQITRQEDKITIYARAGKLTGQEATSSPYHLVQVQKEESWNQELHFTLYLDGVVVVSRSHFIP